MRLLFPCAPDSPRRPDPAFATEVEQAAAAGLEHGLYSHESLTDVPDTPLFRGDLVPGLYLLRGWMLTGDQYARLAESIAARGATLAVDPESYAQAHYLPLAYPLLGTATAESAWTEGDNEEDAWRLYQSFKEHDALIKDWVKSAKHRWHEACLIPAGTDRARFGEIFRAFRLARGHLFNRGTVLRRRLPFRSRGTDLKGFPLIDEFRLFFFRGELLAIPDVPGANALLAHLPRWTALARRFRSPFMTLDVAELDSGEWMVVESGDGGVSGLPLSISETSFYQALATRLA